MQSPQTCHHQNIAEKKKYLKAVCGVKLCQSRFKAVLHPLGPKIDQHQFSPKNISRSSRVKVMRITKLITKGRML